jgi:FdhE protein
VVSRDFQALALERAARARLLAGRYPASREGLLFFAEIAMLQARLAASPMDAPASGRGFALDSLLPGRVPLVELVAARGPERLRGEARCYDETACRESLRRYFTRQDTNSPRSFFARVLLQPAMFSWTTAVEEIREERSSGSAVSGNAENQQFPDEGVEEGAGESTAQLRAAEMLAETGLAREATGPAAVCPRCGQAPQAGCLQPQGDGMALALVCSLCLHEWPFPRVRCPACGTGDHHKISYYSTAEFAHVEVQVCESCGRYLHLVNLAKERQAIADVDELAVLPLDVWAAGKGYRKVQANLLGI